MNPSLMSQLTNQMATGGSPMNVQTPGSPGFQPSLQTPPPAPMPNKSPVSMMHLHGALQRRGIQVPPQVQAMTGPDGNMVQGQEPQVTIPIQDGDPQQPGVQVPASEAELIIRVLSKHLDHGHKMESKIMDAVMPQQPGPTQQPQ